jgi:hypothetical protein
MPINAETRRRETWTVAANETRSQVLADGDEKDPGVFIFVRGVDFRYASRIHTVPGEKILGPLASPEDDQNSGPRVYGIWRRLPEITLRSR